MKKTKVTKVLIPSSGGEMKLLILQPTVNRKNMEKTPGILLIHGGGYAMGMAEMIYMSRTINLVRKYGAVVVTPKNWAVM